MENFEILPDAVTRPRGKPRGHKHVIFVSYRELFILIVYLKEDGGTR